MSRNATKPGLTAAMTAGRALLAAGWRYDSTSPMANDTTIRTLLHPTGREIHARTVDGGEQTDLTMTGLSLEQVAGAVAGAGLGAPAEQTDDLCPDPWHEQPAEPTEPCPACGDKPPAEPTGPHAELVAGLRALADFYENNPTMPVPIYPKLLVSCSSLTGDDDAGAAELVHHAAKLLGVAATPASTGGWDADGRFGPLTLGVYSTTRERMARYAAETSYSGAVEPEVAS